MVASAIAVLLAYAAAREGAGVVQEVVRRRLSHRLVELGVGKIAAAATIGAQLDRQLDRQRPELVLLFGVGGAYPQAHLRAGLSALSPGELCVVERDASVDDGVLGPEGFISLEQIGFGGTGVTGDSGYSRRLIELLGCRGVDAATVSTGAGTDELSKAYAQRSGAHLESMEGAAVGWVCRRVGVPFVQLRAVSNWTGRRDRGAWDLAGAVATLERAMVQIFDAGILG